MELVDETCQWLAKLQIRHDSQDLNKLINDFAKCPGPSYPYLKQLQNEITHLLKGEEEFFLNELTPKLKPGKTTQTPKDTNTRRIYISISKSFRREQVIKGIEIPPSYSFEFPLSEMLDSQREKLVEQCFLSYNGIPSTITLHVPVLRAKKIMIDLPWKANLNPKTTDPAAILSEWEKNFDAAKRAAQQSLEATMNSADDVV